MNETAISQQNASILSLSHHRVFIPHEIQDHLRSQYKHLKVEIDIVASDVKKQVEGQSNVATTNDSISRQVQIVEEDHFSRILSSMKTSPKVTICRVNLILVEDIDSVLEEINEYLVHLFDEDCRRANIGSNNLGDDQPKAIITKSVLFKARRHDIFHDVIEIHATSTSNDGNCAPSSVDKVQSLSTYSKIPPQLCHGEGIFSHWPSRQKSNFPVHYKVIICDRFCGEAVLRGSNIFVRGVLAADRNVECGDDVCVYAHVSSDSIPRGLTIENYHGQHTCVFLGLGKAECTRAKMFNQSAGLAVTMFNNIIHLSSKTFERVAFSTKAGPLLPSMNGILSNKIMLQNLPPILVAHALNPQRKDVIGDLCCAPGGKTSHVASLVNNNATIVAIDKSRKKMKSVKKFFDDMGASCITPLALDSTKCVLTVNESNDETWKSVKEILSVATCNDDGLLDVKGFYPESFDKIVLDPPCSG